MSSQGEQLSNPKTPDIEETHLSEARPEEIPEDRGPVPFPIVAIGASAGGLDPLKLFFSSMPADQRIAFVVIQHLDPKHKSYMGDLIRKHTSMRVIEVEEGMKIIPGCIFLCPPDRELNLSRGVFRLSELKKTGGARLPIDHFFRSLAQDWGEHSTGVIFSGTGTDGTSGLKAIKGNAGMVMVQDPAQAQYTGMPQSAIDTGLVDLILPVEKMPGELLQYFRHPYVKRPAEEIEAEERGFEAYLQSIFALIRAKTGHDFSNYKQNTIRRRIERRMAIHKIVDIKNYLRYLQEDPAELQRLFKDMLIKVTSFFRDHEAFDALGKEVVNNLLLRTPVESVIRVWVPGCASGEEAYSLAILFTEAMEGLNREYTIQIFASDIDAEAISQARAAQYPDNITADVSEDRLNRFFIKDNGTYKVKKNIRQMVVFAVQNVLTDPPFTKLDLISCRNLLIYLESYLQKNVLPLFHYALNPEGYLFLGTSETIGDFHDLFTSIDKKWKIYHRREARRDQISDYPSFAIRQGQGIHRELPVPAERKELKRPNLRDLAERIVLDDYAPPSVIINESFDILYFQGSTDRYLMLPAGEPDFNILNMARQGLSSQIKNATIQALRHKKPVDIEGAQVKGDHEYRKIDLVIRPLFESIEGKELVLVLFFEKASEAVPASRPGKRKKDREFDQVDPRIRILEEKLQATREDLQSTIEELETSNEELKSANEELQSSNEEAQSTNEELETSREELQSTNEELSTVNAELQNKVEELSKANDDINNLLGSTHIATIFLDKELRIMRFTPAMLEVFNLIPTDIGRPISDITSKIPPFDLYQSAKKVLYSLQHAEAQQTTGDGKWYAIRTQPYRTTENVIDGVVISFLDITEVKRSELIAQASRAYAESVVNAVREPLVILDTDFRITSANQAFHRITKTSSHETGNMSIFNLGGGQLNLPELRTLLDRMVADKQSFDDFEINVNMLDRSRRTLLLNGRIIPQEPGLPLRILLAMEDITGNRGEKKEMEKEKGEESDTKGE